MMLIALINLVIWRNSLKTASMICCHTRSGPNILKAPKTLSAIQNYLRLQFLFAISPHNANEERVFSLLQAQWTKERN
jgi:hypothetical protein